MRNTKRCFVCSLSNVWENGISLRGLREIKEKGRRAFLLYFYAKKAEVVWMEAAISGRSCGSIMMTDSKANDFGRIGATVCSLLK